MLGAGNGRFLPLCPWDRADDEDRYLPVDDSHRMYDRFVGSLAAPSDLPGAGQLILVTGDRGCGKTSLIHRCAYSLKSLKDPGYELVIVNLVDNMLLDDDDSAARIHRSFTRIVAKLAPYLEVTDVAALRSMGDTGESFEALGDYLTAGRPNPDMQARPIVVVVILPCYPTVHEVRRYADFAGPGLIFFCEIFDPIEGLECARHLDQLRSARMFTQHLAVGKLKEGDLRPLIERVRLDGSLSPVISDNIVEAYFEPIRRRGQSILELNKFAYGVLKSAAAKSAASVTAEHIADYYTAVNEPVGSMNGSQK